MLHSVWTVGFRGNTVRLSRDKECDHLETWKGPEREKKAAASWGTGSVEKQALC